MADNKSTAGPARSALTCPICLGLLGSDGGVATLRCGKSFACAVGLDCVEQSQSLTLLCISQATRFAAAAQATPTTSAPPVAHGMIRHRGTIYLSLTPMTSRLAGCPQCKTSCMMLRQFLNKFLREGTWQEFLSFTIGPAGYHWAPRWMGFGPSTAHAGIGLQMWSVHLQSGRCRAMSSCIQSLDHRPAVWDVKLSQLQSTDMLLRSLLVGLPVMGQLFQEVQGYTASVTANFAEYMRIQEVQQLRQHDDLEAVTDLLRLYMQILQNW